MSHDAGDAPPREAPPKGHHEPHRVWLPKRHPTRLVRPADFERKSASAGPRARVLPPTTPLSPNAGKRNCHMIVSAVAPPVPSKADHSSDHAKWAGPENSPKTNSANMAVPRKSMGQREFMARCASFESSGVHLPLSFARVGWKPNPPA